MMSLTFLMCYLGALVLISSATQAPIPLENPHIQLNSAMPPSTGESEEFVEVVIGHNSEVVVVDMRQKEEENALLAREAWHGEIKAQHLLGTKYYHGSDGVVGCYDQALAWFASAAIQGLPGAQYDLGNMFFDGTGVEQSDKMAVEWWEKAATQGVVDAQLLMGSMYRAGEGGKDTDLSKAVEWFKMAADQGNVAALLRLGGMYFQVGFVT
jgi:TPR repeat protein